MEELKNIIFENFKAFLVLVILIILAVFLFNNLDIGYRIKCSFGSKESCFIMGNYYSNCSDEYSKDGSTCPMNVKSERDKFDRHHRTYSLVTDYSGNDLGKSTEYNTMTGAITEILNTELGITPDHIYVSYSEFANWGWNGSNF